MADINIPDGQPADSAGAQEGWEIRQAIEMLFFAYRDFTGDPDVILAQS
ncbi:MAG TPA: MarR family transcriptional regulator, partial [Alphaproteobacteria bacterium]|nr:MarR family transcriptional regulator [Alphaproteobacteria bacterium]